jgi:hypothetical protein
VIEVTAVGAGARIVGIDTPIAAGGQAKPDATRVINQQITLDACITPAAPHVDTMLGKPILTPEALDHVVANDPAPGLMRIHLRQNPDTVRAADVAFVAESRIPAEGEPEGFWAIAPDVVVEVVSASDTASGVQSRVADWLGAGCRLVWVIYPDTQSVTEYRSLAEVQVLTADQTLNGGDVLPGFKCGVSEIFK